MYGLPLDADLSFFAGATLIQICFGSYDLQFHFAEQNLVLSVQSELRLTRKDSELLFLVDSENVTSHLTGATALTQLLSQNVANVTWEANGTLTLTFTAGTTMKVLDSSPQYESYTISLSGQPLIVV